MRHKWCVCIFKGKWMPLQSLSGDLDNDQEAAILKQAKARKEYKCETETAGSGRSRT